MKIKRKKDMNKATSLLNMAKISLERLNSLDKLKYPSNTLNDYYDILHKLMESFSSLQGIKFSGDKAHKELIDYSCESLFTDPDKIFLQNLRQFRNQIAYEGFNIKESYLQRNMERIEKYITFLIKTIEEKITKNN